MIKYLLLTLLFASAANAALINWTDNSDNEAGFAVERRLSTETKFIELTRLEANSISYEDNDSLSGNYCYRVGAFNRGGISYSDEQCVDLILPPISPVVDKICQRLKAAVDAFCANE